MARFIKKTMVVQEGNDTPDVNMVENTTTNVATTTNQKVEYLIYFFFGALEILLLFRLMLKVTGASVASDFVRFIYGLTGIFIMPFEGIFRRAVAPGIETTSVFEPSTLVAMIVYAVVAWGVLYLLRVLTGNEPET